MGMAGKGIGTGVGAGAGAIIGGPAGALIGAGIGGGIGGLFDDSGAEAREMMAKALAEYEAIGIPPDLSGPIILQQLQKGGMLTPQLEGVLKEEMFNASTVSDNADTRKDMTGALAQIRSKTFGGLSPQQMSNMQQLTDKVGAQNQSFIKGGLNTLAQQGKVGGGDFLASILGGGQNSSQLASRTAVDIGAAGANAQDQALRDYLTGIGALRSSDDRRNEYNATARQAADIYKSQNASSRQARNVNTSNNANQMNWNRSNEVNDVNTRMNNAELLRQQQAKRDFWNDKYKLAAGKAGAYTGQAQNEMQMANNQNQNWNQIFQGLTSAGGAIYGAQNRAPASTPDPVSNNAMPTNVGGPWNLSGQNYSQNNTNPYDFLNDNPYSSSPNFMNFNRNRPSGGWTP
jgi:hypothetical protein